MQKTALRGIGSARRRGGKEEEHVQDTLEAREVERCFFGLEQVGCEEGSARGARERGGTHDR